MSQRAQRIVFVILMAVMVLMLIATMTLGTPGDNMVDHIEGDTTEVPYEAP
jgi:hypothetical protein